MNSSDQLRPGRHQMSRDQVRAHQRDRILRALETVMPAHGYVDTSVADIIKRAGVSRQTFYELFASKQDCFLAGYSSRQGSVIEAIFTTPTTKSPMDRFTMLLGTYLAVMARDPAMSRLYLIGVYTAGPQAIAKRLELQRQFVDAVAEVFEAQSPQDLFTCQALVAAISTLVTHALLEEDPQAVLDLHQPLVRMARQLMAPE
jgi:TetR/AcrR family transcriptional regulator